MGNSSIQNKQAKLNVYEQVTERILASLDAGVVPWRSPYLAGVGYPRNFSTGKEYRGINVFLLGLAGYSSPWFLTYLQASELGGHVRKGEKGNLVIKYGTYKREDEETDEAQTSRFLKTYSVFNAAQIEGIEFPQPEARAKCSDCEEAKQIVEAMPQRPEIRYGTAQAFYRQSEDAVFMPEARNMSSTESFYSTLFHQLAHATGHASRLARKTLLENKGYHRKGEIYAEEELVAEMASAFLCAHAGILDSELDNHAAYIEGWAKALKEDRSISVIRAASQAQKAADFILGTKPNE